MFFFSEKEVDSHVISDGSILHVQCHPTEPILACCGLDRYLRVCSTRTFTETNKVRSLSPSDEYQNY